MENKDNKWQKHEDWVEKEILNSPEKYIWINKNPQSGFTTSLGKVCVKKGLKFLEVAPYNKIIDDTIANKVMDGKPYGKIASNKDLCKNCFPNPYFKDNNEGKGGIYHCGCKGCSLIQTDLCGYYQVSHNDYPAYGITHSKIDNILRHPSRMGNCRVDILKTMFEKTNVILVDEFANMISWLPRGFYVKELGRIVNEINKRMPYVNLKDSDKDAYDIIEVLNTFILNISKTEINTERN